MSVVMLPLGPQRPAGQDLGRHCSDLLRTHIFRDAGDDRGVVRPKPHPEHRCEVQEIFWGHLTEIHHELHSSGQDHDTGPVDLRPREMENHLVRPIIRSMPVEPDLDDADPCAKRLALSPVLHGLLLLTALSLRIYMCKQNAVN